MSLLRSILIVSAVTLSGTVAPEALADRVRVDLPDGSRWRGETGDQVKVTYKAGARKQTVTGELKAVESDWIVVAPADGEDAIIFKSDIVSIEAAAAAAQPDTPDTPQDPESGDGPAQAGGDNASSADAATTETDSDLPESLLHDPADGMPVFYLPMEGMVGGEFREEEIRAVAAEADKLGPGQTIVLHIDSGGGLVAEWQLIWQTIAEVKKRHRVVAWVKTAISAAASTSLACSCIVFEDNGSLGSITTLMGSQEAPIEMQERGANELKQVLKEGGYSEHFARPFKIMRAMISYDKDPDTGIVTFYPTMEGDSVLSDDKHVLTLNAREAVDCGLSLGIANTKEELAEVLHMGGWNEVGTGQEIFDKWWRDCEACKRDLQVLGGKLGRLNQRDPADIREAIRIVRIFISWWDRTTNICFMNQLPPKSQLELQLKELEDRLRELNRRR